MSKLAEILQTGIAPGMNLRTVDPTLPEKAVPKAFRDLEQKHGASKIAREAGFSVKDIKRIWNMLALLTALLATTANAGDLTRSITFSDGQRITAAQLHTLVDGASVNATFLTGKNLNSTVETADYVLVYDTSAGLFTKMTLSTLLMANTGLITTQTDDPNPAYNDYVLTYDASAASFAKVSITNLLYNTNLIAILPNITNLTQSATMWVRHSGTNAQIEVTNLWLNFKYRAAFTNLVEHTAPTNTDKLLIFDATAGTNKWTGLSGLVTNLPTVTTNGPNDWFLVVTNGNVSKISGNSLSNVIAAQLVQNTLPRKFATYEYSLIAGTIINTNHGLSAMPDVVRAVFVCKTNDTTFLAGDEVDITGIYNTAGGSAVSVRATTTTLIANGNTGSASYAAIDTSGNGNLLTTARWRLKLYAIYHP